MLNIPEEDGWKAAQSQADIAFDILLTAIVGCDIKPGEEVSEAPLSQRFGIGKGSVRLALARLRQRGLVSVTARRGYRVAPIALRDIRDIFDMRRALEPLAASGAAGQADVERLRQLDAMWAAGKPGDQARQTTALQAHRRLHLAIAAASGNRRLTLGIADLWDETTRILHHGGVFKQHAAELAHDHDALIQALGRGDAEQAGRLVAEEIDGLFNIVVKAVLRSDSALAPAAAGAVHPAGMMTDRPPS